MEPDIDYEKSLEPILPPTQKPRLDLTHSDVKRTLEEKLDQPQYTVLAAAISTMHKITQALRGDLSEFED